MEQSRVDFFMATAMDKFPAERLPEIRSTLERMDDSRFSMMQTVSFNNPILLLVISLLVGSWGIDRFMVGDIGLGVAKLLTCGGFGIWWLVDLFLIMDRTKEENYKRFITYAAL